MRKAYDIKMTPNKNCPICLIPLQDYGNTVYYCKCGMKTVADNVYYRYLDSRTEIQWHIKPNIGTYIFIKNCRMIRLDYILPFDININRLNRLLLLK